MSALSYFFPLSIAAVVTLGACTSTIIDSPAAAFGSGPPIAADQVGGFCTGVGTSPGDTALFAKTDCPAGLCVADARTGFDTYCTADCEAHACPSGFLCKAITLGDKKHACLKDPNAPARDAGTATMPTPSVDSSDAGHAEEDAAPTTIGTKVDKGINSVDVNISSHGTFYCDDTCKAEGGTCVVGGNGAGWVDYKYNDGSGRTGNQIYSCDDPQAYKSGNVTLTGMSCFCSGVTVPTTVRVAHDEGTFPCATVCASWSLACSRTRKSATYADVAGVTSSPLTCTAMPSASADHYVCACE